MSATVVSIRNLSKIYSSGWLKKSSFEAVSDLSFEVKAGEIFAFLGPNGAGKSTTINLLMGFLQPTRGAVSLFGQSPGDRNVRAKIGYLPENFAFYPFLTAPGLLDLFGRLFRISAQDRSRRIEELLQKLGLWNARNLKIGKYSRGMRQRVGIAQSLLNEPELLILDEPTSGFDPVGRRMVRDLLIELKQRGTSIFLCSHILSEVEDICDRVAIIKRGKLISQGTLGEIVGLQGGYEITFSDNSGSALTRLRKIGFEVMETEECLKISTIDEQSAQIAVDALRASGGILKEFAPKARTLEDVFFNAVNSMD